jgi:protocatechuate 3,4-dioxygenase beta subunit
MDARRRVLGGVLLVGAAAAASWWFTRDREVALVGPQATADADAPAPAVGLATASQPAEASVGAAAAAPERKEVPGAPAAEPRRTATLKGRCVDADSRPMAGCAVRLSGWTGNQKGLDAWLLEHGTKPEWTDPPAVTTTDDGTFAFTFWPPPPWQFALDVQRDGSAAMSGRWSKLEGGSTTDVGDIVLTAGVRVTGRIVDTKGQPLEKVYVGFDRQDSRQLRSSPFGKVEARTHCQAYSRADGAFATTDWLAPGTYEVRVQEQELDKPASIELAAERPVADVTITVKAVADVPVIRGRVVDESAQPIGGARVEARSERRGPGASASSKPDGTFELRRRQGNEATAALLVSAEGFEAETTPRQVPWGTKDVEFRLARGSTLTLRVTDAADAPVETYSVRLISRNRNAWSSRDRDVRAQGRHENGTVTIDGITRGDWLVIVEFPTAAALDVLFEPLQVTGRAPTRLDLRAGAAQRRSLRVLAADDAPVAGTRVQLCELFGGRLDEHRMVMRRDRWLMNTHDNHALVVFEGETGADGRLELRGPGNRELGLCLLGPGHVPCKQAGVRLDDESELVVRVGRGARLVGKVVPPEALVELRRLVKVGPSDPFPAGERPRLNLRAQDGGRRFPSAGATDADTKGLFIAEDGSFDADGLPAGPWLVQVVGWEISESLGHSIHFDTGNVVLTDGQTTHTDLDLQSILPGTVDGLVTKNGAALAKAVVTLKRKGAWINLTTDEAGQFTQCCRPGTYTLIVQGRAPMLRCPTTVTVERGETVRQTFVVGSGTLQLTVLDAAGQPAPAIELHTSPDNDNLPPTGADGKVTVELTAQNATLQVLPQRLMTDEARAKIYREAAGNTDPFAPHWLTVGSIAVQAGQTHELVVRLPPEWSQ